jgi:hypothetical protein
MIRIASLNINLFHFLLEAIYPEMMTKIQFELAAKPLKANWEAKGLYR